MISGAVLIAILSAVIVWFLCAVWPHQYKVLWVVIVPLALSNCLYWSQAWLEIHHGSKSQYEQGVIWSEYRNWEFVLLIPWFLAGIIPSAAIALLLGKRRDDRSRPRIDVMTYLDYACAWTIFVAGLVSIVMTEVRHAPGAVLDTPLLWIFVAMFNFLRLRNDDGVNGLRIFCIGANLSEFTFEIARMKMWGLSSLIVGVPLLAETVFSIIRSKRRSQQPSRELLM